MLRAPYWPSLLNSSDLRFTWERRDEELGKIPEGPGQRSSGRKLRQDQGEEGFWARLRRDCGWKAEFGGQRFGQPLLTAQATERNWF